MVTYEQIYRNSKLLDEKNDEIIRLGKTILKKFNYNTHAVYPETLIIENVNEAIEVGIDDIIFPSEIPCDDPLNFKHVKPSNNNYFSIDYRSNNFGNYNVENDDYIFVKLMELLPKKWYNKEVLLEKVNKGKDIRIKGILSYKNPDYLFFIRNTYEKPRDNILENSLINAYLLPVEYLKLQCIYNLNMIRGINDEKPLDFEKDIVDLILDIYRTWELYNEKNHNFELFKAKDINRPDLIMKISKDQLLNYIKFDLNGLISEYKF